MLLDKFLFYDFILVALLVFIDWLFGETKRASIRNKVGDFWLKIASIDYKGLLKEDALRVRKVFVKVLGKPFFSVHFFMSNLVLSYLIQLTLGLHNIYEESVWIFLTLVILAAFASYTSLSVTYFLLGIMAKQDKLILIVLLVVLDFAIAIVFYILHLMFGFFIFQKIPVLDYLVSEGSVLAYIAYVFIPSVPFLVIAIIFILTKLFRVVIQPITGAVLYAFYDSKKGVLSVLATGIGSIAKIVQLYINQ